jgi:hypothetical protein
MAITIRISMSENPREFLDTMDVIERGNPCARQMPLGVADGGWIERVVCLVPAHAITEVVGERGRRREGRARDARAILSRRYRAWVMA